jgi:hypothetical protein
MFFESSEESSNTESEDFSQDPRVSSALDALDIPYECDPSTGRFEVLVQLKEGRSQTVFINSATNKFLGIELREISSAALESDGSFDARTANLLLRDNSEMVHGNWSIHVKEDSSRHFAIFSMTGLASLEPDPLSSIIHCVAEVADEMEHRLSGLDEF